MHFLAVMSHPPFFLEVRTCTYVGRKKGILTVGAVWCVVVCGETPDPFFCIRGGSCLKHTLCPEFRPVSKGGRHISIHSTISTLITVSGLALQLHTTAEAHSQSLSF